MKVCRKCGNDKLIEGIKYCLNCGADVEPVDTNHGKCCVNEDVNKDVNHPEKSIIKTRLSVEVLELV